MNKNVIYAALMFVVTMSSGNASAQQFPYQNPALSAHERAVDLCGRLTLEEKASLMLDDSPAIPRLGIKRFQWWSEALHGVANMGDVTVFPEPIGMAASFNDRMVYRVFDATSDEMRAKWNELQQKGGDVTRFHALSVWTPNVNIFRDPRWGRGQETYGEDPYLTSRMGCAVVRGLQGPEDTKYRKLWACAKHYAIHSGPEWARHTDNITERLFTSLVAFCMLFSVSAVPAFAAETTTEITDTQQPVVIGEYDGYLTDVMISDGVTKRAVANVRINSYATYDEDDGIQVHVKLYVPWYESPKPEFTGMTGTVNVLMNKKSTNTAFAELADGEETIETDVDTGRTGNSGDKGTVSVSGVATANNALAGGGAFAISYPVTLP